MNLMISFPCYSNCFQLDSVICFLYVIVITNHEMLLDYCGHRVKGTSLFRKLVKSYRSSNSLSEKTKPTNPVDSNHVVRPGGCTMY